MQAAGIYKNPDRSDPERRLMIIPGRQKKYFTFYFVIWFALQKMNQPRHTQKNYMKQSIIPFLLLSFVILPASAQKASAKASMVKGQKVYELYCLPCHQVDGSGVFNMNPPLIKTPFLLGDQKKLIQIILKGLNEDIEVDGNTYSNPMPPFGDILKDEEIADVLTYVRNSFGNKASVITPAQVKTVRAAK
jgi:mono/diheme cytochrome c family protein